MTYTPLKSTTNVSINSFIITIDIETFNEKSIQYPFVIAIACKINNKTVVYQSILNVKTYNDNKDLAFTNL
jgi:hypothetical protein